MDEKEHFSNNQARTVTVRQVLDTLDGIDLD